MCYLNNMNLIYVIYFCFLSGVVGNHIFRSKIHLNYANAPLMFKNIFKNITYYFKFSKVHFLSYKNCSSLKINNKKVKVILLLYQFHIIKLHIIQINTMNSKQLIFLSNNVKGLQEGVKRTKVLEYLKNCVHSNGFVFLQETHSSITDEKK